MRSAAADGQTIPSVGLSPEELARLRELEVEYFTLIRRQTSAEIAIEDESLRRVEFERYVGSRLLIFCDQLTSELQPRLHLVGMAATSEEIPEDAKDALLWALEDVGNLVDQLQTNVDVIRKNAKCRVEAELGRWVPFRDEENAESTQHVASVA
ncbi:MAG: hypothetical protein AcusKO_14650 [Acuticoccus sp.]